MMKLTNTMTWIAAAVVVLGAGGCSDNSNGLFQSDGTERVSKFTEVQASNGARNDAQLYAYHFNAGHLNSLGRAKVMMMLEDCESCEPITVHLVRCGEGDLLTQRKAAVELYLKTTDGPNTLAFHPAAPDLLRFSKTESPNAADAPTAAAPTAGAASPATN